MVKNGSTKQHELDSIIEEPPKNAKPETGAFSEAELKALLNAMKAKSDISLKSRITETAILLLKVCIGFIMLAYVIDKIISVFGLSDTSGNSKDFVTLVQYIVAMLAGYLFGQAGSKD